MKTKTLLATVFVLAYTAIILTLSFFLKEKAYPTIINNKYLNFQFNYQSILLIVVTLSLLTTYFLDNRQFKAYFNIGQLNAKTEALKFFGIKNGDRWVKTGLTLSIVISSVTAIFMFIQLDKTIPVSNFVKLLPWIVLFSATNALGEEVIYRLGLIAPLTGIVKPSFIFLISSILFGLPHLAGMPDGLIGATMAGILGYVLAKSVYETKGLFWAWWIHFLQDVVIISVLTISSV